MLSCFSKSFAAFAALQSILICSSPLVTSFSIVSSGPFLTTTSRTTTTSTTRLYDSNGATDSSSFHDEHEEHYPHKNPTEGDFTSQFLNPLLDPLITRICFDNCYNYKQSGMFISTKYVNDLQSVVSEQFNEN